MLGAVGTGGELYTVLAPGTQMLPSLLLHLQLRCHLPTCLVSEALSVRLTVSDTSSHPTQLCIWMSFTPTITNSLEDGTICYLHIEFLKLGEHGCPEWHSEWSPLEGSGYHGPDKNRSQCQRPGEPHGSRLLSPSGK